MKLLVKIFFGVIFSVSAGTFNQKSVEQNALDFVVHDLIKKRELVQGKGAINKILPMGDDFFEELFSANQIYSDGQVCMLSRPFYFLEDSLVIMDNTLFNRTEGFYKDFDRKKDNGYDYTRMNLPDNIKLKSFNDFENENLKGALFIVTRQSLFAQNNYLVEVHITSTEFIDNYARFTFHIYLDANKNVYDWEFSQQDEFDFYEPCFN